MASGDNPTTAVWAVAACGTSLSASYIKAKGEAAIASSKKIVPYNTLNRMFADGLASFEVRICLLVLGLLTGLLLWATIFISVLAAYTALERLVIVSKKLS